ncbi:hypothetical protein O181_130059 [Austropuccinia psidii MF-1]|uniref:Uncharacterized protein n=1 Tax=Austropuccinia psidii MF-1 TaxID=1389203 RepID=A0A9Q3Q9P4_9BASI|nr:hypothetical protein [Austropuccinia psidii MF-1]
MAIMNPSLEENILPLKIGLSIGMKPKKKNKTKHKILMKKVQIVMPTDETIYLPFTVEGSANHLILGKEFCHYFSVIKSIHKSSIEDEESKNSQDIGIEGEEEMKQKGEFYHSKEEEEGENSLNTLKVNPFHSEGIYDMEHTHTGNEDFSEENQKSFNIRKSKEFNLFERDKKQIQETLASENDLFIDDIPDLFSGLFNQGNNLNNTPTFSKPEEEIQALLEEIFKGNPQDNEVLSQPQESSTHQEGPPIYIQELNQNWDINSQTPHFQVKTDEPSYFKVTFSKEMDKKPFEGILKKEDDENQPLTSSERAGKDQLASEEKEVLKLYDALFNMNNKFGPEIGVK